MPKIPTSYRLEQTIVQALDKLTAVYSTPSKHASRADVLQILIVRDTIDKLDDHELRELFDDDMEILTLIRSIKQK